MKKRGRRGLDEQFRREAVRLAESRTMPIAHVARQLGVHTRIFHVTVMCRVLEVSRAGYYKWRKQPLAERVKADGAIAARIRAIHTGRKRSYGSPRVHRELRDDGIRCGEKRVARVMRD